MKKILSILFVALLVISSFTYSIGVSAAEETHTATLYVTDTNVQTTEITPRQTLTANVGDTVEITVTAHLKTDRRMFMGFWIETFFNQDSASDIDFDNGNGVMTITDTYYQDGAFVHIMESPKSIVVINPEKCPSDDNGFAWISATPYNAVPVSQTQVIYSFTVKIENPGISYVNTVLHNFSYTDDNGETINDFSLFDMITTAEIVSHSDLLYGDVDGDGDVTVTDATLIQKHCARIEQLEGNAFILADFNGDNQLTVREATQIQQYIAKLTPSEIIGTKYVTN